MELLKEEELPEPVELGARHVVPDERHEELGVVQRALGAPVPELRAGLRGIDASVVLEVELSDDDGSGSLLGLERVEELLARALGRTRHALEVVSTTQRLEHRSGRATAAISVSEQEQRGRR